MEVFKKTVSAVFGTERRYVIPLFQRPYVWSKERQWEPLWEDIADRADKELEPAKQDTPPHFLGAIVIQQLATWGDDLLAHDVIDGQQRLTTLQILLTAFHDLAATCAEEKQVTTSLLSWTRNATAIAAPDVEQFKVWPTGRDVEQFRLVVTAGSRDNVERLHPPVFKRKKLQSRPRMVEAYLFFHEKIAEWLSADGGDKVSERTKALRRVFDKRMQLVSIELEREEDPQAIFETLNARGVPLLASDLLRNFIFQRAEQGHAERLHQRYWTRFEVPNDAATPEGPRFWEVEERQGRLSRARLDLLVQHYLTMKTGTEVLSGRLFPEYKDWITKQKPFATLEAELEDFTGFAEHFAELLRPSSSSALGRFGSRLRALDTSTAYPLVLAILGNDAIPDAERQAIFGDLEAFLVRRVVCRRPTKSYNRLFLQILREFAQGNPTRASFHAILAAGRGENADWPDNAAFDEAWNTLDAYSELKPMKVEMILRALNDAMPAAEKITIAGALTVEHILPQEWLTHWPLPTGIDPEVARERREEVVHDFGNLTLLTAGLNSSVSNGPSDKKLPRIALDSSLRLNTYFQSRTVWSEADIAERGAALLRVAKRVWPAP